MLENKYKQITISEHISLYDKIIPKDHFLRKLKENVDFSFVNKLVEKEYSQELGRPATEPELMYKLLFLQIKDLLSDREVIERAKTDMAYKFFLDLNPEDTVPCYSLLSIFRNTKIKDEAILEEMLKETVQQAKDKGVIGSKSIIVDAVHSVSKSHPKTPTQILRELSKNLRKEIYRTKPELKEVFPTKPEETATLEEEIEYTKQLVENLKEKITEETEEKIKKKYEKVKRMLEDEKLKEIQSAVDTDAKQGYKSEDNDFFGYKSHVAMTPERIVTALEITSGEAPDGKYLPNLVEKSERAGIEVTEVIGDKAYSGKENLEYGKSKNISIISKLNPIISNGVKREDGFEYIKDADTIRCPMGKLATSKKYEEEKIDSKGKNQNARMKYKFATCDCQGCPNKENCLGKKTKYKTYTIRILSEIHEEQIKFEETEYFKEKLRYERYKIEAKNGETKQAHGLCKAKYVGLQKMTVQSYLTHIVTNIKRIIKEMDKEPDPIKQFFCIFLNQIIFYSKKCKNANFVV